MKNRRLQLVDIRNLEDKDNGREALSIWLGRSITISPKQSAT
jgi:hypothetical protein